MDKIRLADCYPYTYVRVITMKSKLLSRDDYNKLLKMEFSGITKFLQDSEYKKEINQLALEMRGADLLESALNMNLAESFIKLQRISPDELNLLIGAYLQRYDVYNLKTLLRGKFSGMPVQDIKKLLIQAGPQKAEIEKLSCEDSVEEVLSKSSLLNKKALIHALSAFKTSRNLLDIENALDKAYFENTFELANHIPTQGELFKQFLLYEIDILNLKMLLRLKRQGVPESSISNYCFMFGSELNKDMIIKLTRHDMKAMLKMLETTRFKAIIKKHHTSIETKESLIWFENDLDRYLLNKSITLLHQFPLSIDIILGYMFAKEIEVRNLKALVKGKQLGMDEAFISSQLIT